MSRPQDPRSPEAVPEPNPGDANHTVTGEAGNRPMNAGHPGGGGKAGKIGWIVAWALSLVLAFMLGAQTSRSDQAVTPAGGTQSASPTPGAASATPTQPEQVTQFLRELPRRDPEDPLALGKPDAKVVMTEWSDWRCPFCAVWAKRTLPALQPYIDDGTLRIEYRDMQIFGEESVTTGVAARAAGEQGKFWPYYHAIFDAAPESGHPNYQRADLIRFAQTAGVPDLKKFEADLDNPTLREAVLTDTQQAQQMGISGTPFFVVGTTPISGAQPTEAFVQAVQQAAAE